MKLAKSIEILDRHFNKNYKTAKSDFLKELFLGKQKHSFDVLCLGTQLMGKIDYFKNLPEDEKNEIEAALLLHDIARFYQSKDGIKKLTEAEFDHGIEGYNILKNTENIINPTILLPIKYHSKIKIDAIYSDEEFLSCSKETQEKINFNLKLLRDADKLSHLIYFSVHKKITYVDFEKQKNNIPTPKNLDNFINLGYTPSDARKTYGDRILFLLSWFYVVNFKKTMDFVKEYKTIEFLFSILDKKTREKIEPIFNKKMKKINFIK